MLEHVHGKSLVCQLIQRGCQADQEKAHPAHKNCRSPKRNPVTDAGVPPKLDQPAKV
jgi:hypothetical protein